MESLDYKVYLMGYNGTIECFDLPIKNCKKILEILGKKNYYWLTTLPSVSMCSIPEKSEAYNHSFYSH